MMEAGLKTLTLLRHAKSGWDDAITRDFDRPLNPKGRRAAQVMGRHLRGESVAFDHVVASPAVRVRETLEALSCGLGAALRPSVEARLYLASAETILDVIRELPDAADRVLLVGHNPGLEELVVTLVADEEPLRATAAEKYPTATVAELVFVDSWRGVGAGTARLTRFVRPRDLDPELGPDD